MKASWKIKDETPVIAPTWERVFQTSQPISSCSIHSLVNKNAENKKNHVLKMTFAETQHHYLILCLHLCITVLLPAILGFSKPIHLISLCNKIKILYNTKTE